MPGISGFEFDKQARDAGRKDTDAVRSDFSADATQAVSQSKRRRLRVPDQADRAAARSDVLSDAFAEGTTESLPRQTTRPTMAQVAR